MRTLFCSRMRVTTVALALLLVMLSVNTASARRHSVARCVRHSRPVGGAGSGGDCVNRNLDS